MAKYLSAAEAAARLGVNRATLYAYVSRGHLRAEPDPRDVHSSRYPAAEVEQLRDRTQARLNPGEAARKTLHFGLPVLESAITSIENGRLSYRGQDAIQLARAGTFEDAIRVLWQADPTARRPAVTLPASIRGALRSLPPVDRMQLVLPVAARADRDAHDRDAARLVAAGLRIVGLLAAAATLRPLARGRAIAAHLASAWRSTDAGTAAAIEAALVLCADHELNASTFAVRVAASAGSSPYDAVLAGLCTLRGSHHGGLTDRLEALIEEAGSPRRFRSVLERRLRRQQAIPGFGHPLYPDGDPRARLLHELAANSPRGADWAEAFTRAGADVVGDHPTLDAGLVLLRRALGLPRGTAFQLFAIGRSAGWIAHAMEQYQSGQLIRPRAVYPRDRPEG